MTVALVVLGAGVVLAGIGGEFFVRGAVGLASWARVPAGLVGATVAAFATSAPELSVGLQSALDDQPELALGDALGSNVVNVALVLGVVVVLGPLEASRREIRRELAFAMAAPLLTLLALVDGRLTRPEGAVLLLVFAVWLVAVGRAAMGERSAAEDVIGEPTGWPTVAALVAGLAGLVAAGRLIVVAAGRIGDELGWDPFVVGVTMVALGTSAPELATALVARRRGHSEVGVGTLLGSNVFNNLWIVGVVALVSPVETQASEVILAVGACSVALCLVVPGPTGWVPRRRGPLLLATFVVYLASTVVLGP